MTFKQLQYGDVFYIDSMPYQLYHKSQRIASALILTEDYDHIPDPTDSSGFGLATTVFSDLRINTNNATREECEAYLNQLKHEKL
jgi:hypothetical protein